ncbi:MAG: hypothetical protein B7X03_01750 [Parcubacteria group bacterium 21-58-10]|nr:MAG: hypothetical protein B7X03_01750 [Parcubacteria group bacterium 21-58-10]
MKDTDEDFMQLALEQAGLALNNSWIPVGAVFVRNGQVVAHGRKTGINHPLFDHAEHNGCYQALWSREGPRNLDGFTVYTTLEPCIMCLSMLMTARVSRIVYALDDPYGGGGFLLKNPSMLCPRFQEERPVITGGVLQEASKDLLRQFFSKQVGAKNWSDKNNPLVKLVMG